MDDVARLCERVMVLDRGKLVADGPAREVFSRREFLESMRLKPPEVTILMEKLRKRGWAVRNDVLTVEEAYAEIVEELRRKGVAGAV